MSAIGDTLGARRRLDSWKEIALFFGRDERTVKRWEKERGLPVYRVPGSTRGGVFAYADELDRWLQGSAVDEAPSAVEQETTKVLTWESSLPRVEPSNVHDTGKAQSLSAAANSVRPKPRWLVWSFVALIIATASGAWILVRRPFASPKTVSFITRLPNPAAQELYLKGRYHWNKRTPEDLNQAVDLFTQAIVRDPGYAEAYAGLADSYNLLREFSAMRSEDAFSRAIAAASKAIELNPNLADAHASLAFCLFWGNVDVPSADLHFRRAIELDPSNSRAHHWYGTFLNEIGASAQALGEIEKARQLDPSSTPILADNALILFMNGNTQEGVRILKQIETAEPGFSSAPRYLSAIYFNRGDIPAYLREAKIGARLDHDALAQTEISAEAKAFAGAGLHGLFDERLKLDKNLMERDLANDFNLAMDYALLDEKSEAIHYLQLAYAKREYGVSTIAVNPALKNLHGDPEFESLLATLHLPQVAQ
jgi:tetratricopeptide (TPR) repeat protein